MIKPTSDVSNATGLVGAVGLLLTLATVKLGGLNVALASLALLVGTALPMILWTVFVEKVHHRKTTGFDYHSTKPLDEVISLTITKSLGLVGTFAAIGIFYFSLRYYLTDTFNAYLAILKLIAVPLVPLGIAYIGITTRYMTEPKDGLWHFGKLLSFQHSEVDFQAVTNHLRSWAVKAFFLAFMISIYPSMVNAVLTFDLDIAASDPANIARFLVQLLYLFDVCFGTIGYIVTIRPLDTHIRTANPYAAGWAAALVCYPPIVLMHGTGALDYTYGTQQWYLWFAGSPYILAVWGGLIVVLTFVYAWSTVVFGLRFSNLTNRGIITDGPYHWFKHPAYLSKNAFWWLTIMPFMNTNSVEEAVRNCLLLVLINVIYYTRAKTEERHLMADPKYRAYSVWIAENGILSRLLSAVRSGWRPGSRPA